MATLRVQQNLSISPELAEAFDRAAKLSKLSKAKLLEKMVLETLEDMEDVALAQVALKQPGRKSLEEMKKKYRL